MTTFPTADEIRAGTPEQLDVWVAEFVMEMPWCGGNPIPNYSGKWPWPYPVSTDPAASAELERWLWKTGAFAEIVGDLFRHDDDPPQAQCVLIVAANGDEITVAEPFATDPVAARCTALAKCAVLWAMQKGGV